MVVISKSICIGTGKKIHSVTDSQTELRRTDGKTYRQREKQREQNTRTDRQTWDLDGDMDKQTENPPTSLDRKTDLRNIDGRTGGLKDNQVTLTFPT